MRRAAACIAASAALATPAAAGPAPLTVLVWAPIDPQAQASGMTPAEWTRIVDAWANVEHLVRAEGEPTLASCREAHALYYLKAPFLLRGDSLVTSVQRDGRISARTHGIAVNCVTQATVYDRSVDFLSAAADDSGDNEGSAANVWSAPAGKALGRAPLPFADVARVVIVRPHLAYLDVRQAPGNGEGSYLVFAHADGSPSAAGLLPIAESTGSRLAVMLTPSGPAPQVGDYAEYVPTRQQ